MSWAQFPFLWLSAWKSLLFLTRQTLRRRSRRECRNLPGTTPARTCQGLSNPLKIELRPALHVSQRLLSGILSVVAGSADATCFLGAGLFSAHVTGNLVILAAHIVAGRQDNGCLSLSVPLFILMLCVARLLAAGLNAIGLNSLSPLLLLEFLLLVGSFASGLADTHLWSNNGTGISLAGQLSVAAMAVQNALGQLDIPKAPSTAVMTTNITRFVMDVGEALLGRDPVEMLEARRQAKETWPTIVGFTAGAALGAAGFAIAGRKSLVIPAALALSIFAISLFIRPSAKSETGS